MPNLEMLSLIATSGWASGINLYLTVAGLGIAHKMEWMNLPSGLDVLAHPGVIAFAIGLYLIEFVADKVPFVDSAWDAVHTIIRPLGASMIGFMAMSGTDPHPALQMSVAILTGTLALDSHLTKATARAAINTSPEPFSNTAASLTEDVAVVGIMVLVAQHPILAAILVILFVIFSIWFLKVMFRFVKKVFSGYRNKKKSVVEEES